MREITTIEVSALVNELQSIRGFYFDKFYEVGRGRFRFRLSRQGEKEELLCILKHALNLTHYIEKGKQESNFYAAVRKRITGYKIERIEQLNEDRIIKITASRGEEEIGIVFEMFGKGNLLIVDKDMKILLAYTQAEFKDRSVRSGILYQPPQSKAVPLSMANSQSVLRIISECKDKSTGITAFLSKSMNIGALYIENAIAGSGVNTKEEVDKVSGEEAARIAESIAAIKRYTTAPEPIVYRANGNAVDYAICSISKYEGLASIEAQHVGSLQEALDIYYHEITEENNRPEEAGEIKAIRKSLERQRELLKSVEEEEEHSRKAGETIFKNMELLNKVISELREKKRISVEELQNMFPEIKIIGLDLKDKTVTIELRE
ncbi:MAG: NFACT family protein [Candidatus Micrarchaeaceae archaeon]